MDITGSLEAALMAALTGDSPPLFDAAPVFAQEAPQGQAAPYVVYRIVSATPWLDLEGDTGTDQRRVQFDVLAETFEDSVAIARALRGAMAAISQTSNAYADPEAVIQSATFSNLVDFLEETTDPKLHRRSLDFFITCKEE